MGRVGRGRGPARQTALTRVPLLGQGVWDSAQHPPTQSPLQGEMSPASPGEHPKAAPGSVLWQMSGMAAPHPSAPVESRRLFAELVLHFPVPGVPQHPPAVPEQAGTSPGTPPHPTNHPLSGLPPPQPGLWPGRILRSGIRAAPSKNRASPCPLGLCGAEGDPPGAAEVGTATPCCQCFSVGSRQELFPPAQCIFLVQRKLLGFSQHGREEHPGGPPGTRKGGWCQLEEGDPAVPASGDT